MFGFEFGEGGRGIGRESFENHLEPVAAAWSNFIQGVDFMLLQRVLVHVVEGVSVIQEMVPVSDHSEVADLRINPAAFLKGINTAAEAGNERSAVEFQVLMQRDAG